VLRKKYAQTRHVNETLQRLYDEQDNIKYNKKITGAELVHRQVNFLYYKGDRC